MNYGMLENNGPEDSGRSTAMGAGEPEKKVMALGMMQYQVPERPQPRGRRRAAAREA